MLASRLVLVLLALSPLIAQAEETETPGSSESAAPPAENPPPADAAEAAPASEATAAPEAAAPAAAEDEALGAVGGDLGGMPGDELGTFDPEYFYNLERSLLATVSSATLTEQQIELAPSIVSVITADQMRALGIRTLSEALQMLAGVSVLDTQFGDQNVAIRGIANPANILLTLDGHRLNDFYDSTFFTDMPLENIDRIEVIRGPGSALYGTNAFSGVVSLYSRKPHDEVRGGASGEVLLDDSVGRSGRAYLSAGKTFGAWSLRGFGLFYDTTGPRVQVEQDNTVGLTYSQVPGETRGERRMGMGQVSVERRGLFADSDSLQVTGAMIYRRRGPYFGPHRVFVPDSSLMHMVTLGQATYDLPLSDSLRLRVQALADRSDDDDQIQDQPNGYYFESNGNFTAEPGEIFPEGKRRRFQYTAYRTGLRATVSHEVANPGPFARNTLLVGGEFEYGWLPEFTYGQNYKAGLYQGPQLRNHDNLQLTQLGQSRTLAAAFVQDQLQLTQNLNATAGLRVDAYSGFGVTVNPRAALVWQPRHNVTTKLLYGRAFRAPNFREMYDQTGQQATTAGLVLVGNPDLKPEITNTVEAAVEFSPVSRLNLRANGFYIQTDDAIDLDWTYNVAGNTLANYHGRRIYGGEAEVQAVLNAQNYVTANVSWFNSTQLGEGLPGYEVDGSRRFFNKDMVDIPRLRVNGILQSEPLSSWTTGAWSRLGFGLRYSFVAESRNNSRTTFEALYPVRRPAFHELAVVLRMPVWDDRTEISLEANHAFGRTAPVPLASNWYELPTGSNAVILSLDVKL